jgi:hypothetical protein
LKDVDVSSLEIEKPPKYLNKKDDGTIGKVSTFKLDGFHTDSSTASPCDTLSLKANEKNNYFGLKSMEGTWSAHLHTGMIKSAIYISQLNCVVTTGEDDVVRFSAPHTLNLIYTLRNKFTKDVQVFFFFFFFFFFWFVCVFVGDVVGPIVADSDHGRRLWGRRGC